MTARSESLASLSQTVLLIFGFGGLLVAMSVLGVVAAIRGWAPKPVAVGTLAAAAAIVGMGALTSGPVIWLTLATLPMLWALAFGIVLLLRGRFGIESSNRA